MNDRDHDPPTGHDPADVDRSFSRRWQERFIERGTNRDDDAGIAVWTPASLASRMRQFHRHWRRAQPSGALWLDLGCGAGSYCRLLHEEGRTVVGVDYAAPSLRKARERSPAAIRWILAEARGLPFPDHTFDGALCFGLMQTVEASEPPLTELARVVRPGGEIWVDALNAACLSTRRRERRRRRARLPPLLRYETAASFRAAVADSGLECLSWHWLPLAPDGWPWLQALLETEACGSLLRRFPGPAGAISHSFMVRARVPPAQPSDG